jgi:hypothetical protein
MSGISNHEVDARSQEANENGPLRCAGGPLILKKVMTSLISVPAAWLGAAVARQGGLAESRT